MSTTNSNGRWEFDENGNVHYVEPEGSSAESGTHTYNYNYQYNYNTGSGKQSASRSSRSKKSDDSWHWILIVLGFVIAWPVGLVLLFMQLSGKWPGSQKVEQEFHRAANAAQNAARSAARQFEQAQANKRQAQTEAKAAQTDAKTAQWQETMQATRAAQEKKQARKEKKKKAKRDREDGAAYGLGNIKTFRIVGGVLTGVFGFSFVMELIDELTYFLDWSYLLSETLPLLAFMLAGVTLLGVAGSRKRKLRLFQKYVTMIGSKRIVPLAALSAAMGKSEKKVEKDLEEMLERGVLDQGYVDAARRALVLGSPLEDMLETEPEPETQTQPEATDNATATLRHIRSINDAIANREISDKIDRIEELTAKIFRLLEERPEKAGELRSFMNYYLPQTLKILESYSKLEAQGIEGENIAEAKQKIEAMMDKLVDGYETQLDKLFADDVLDISADLKVMESMLEKDGLTVDSELHF